MTGLRILEAIVVVFFSMIAYGVVSDWRARRKHMRQQRDRAQLLFINRYRPAGDQLTAHRRH